VANYNVDIAVALKGAKQLTSFNREVKATTTNINAFEKQLKSAAKDQNLLVKSFDNLNKVLATAKANFNAVASGTKGQNRAAQELLGAERRLNKEYEQRNRLLDRFRNRSKKFTATEKAIRRNEQLRERKSIQEIRSPAAGSFRDFSKSATKFQRTITTSSAYRNPDLVGPFQASQLENIPGFGMGSLQGQSSPVGDRIAKALENEKKLVKEVEAIRGRASKKRAANTKRQLALEKRSNAFVKKAIKEEAALRKKAEREANQLAAKRRERRRRFGSTASSAIIGGAFPLLFGQTGAAAVGGGIGGLAGGAIGGQFGFALSILGTAIGSAVDKADKFNKSLVDLNTRMGTTGSATAITAKEVNNLAKNLNITKEEAFGVLGAFREFGDGNIAKSMAMIFGTDTGGADRFAGLDRSAKLAQEIFNSRKQIGNEAAKNLLIQNKSVDAAVIELALVKAKVKAEQDAAIARARAVSPFDQLRAGTPGLLLLRMMGKMKVTEYGDIRAENLQKKFTKENITLLENYKEGIIEARELLNLLRESQGEFGVSGVLNFNAITDKVKDLQDEMKALQDPIRAAITLSDTISTSFEESFKGIIKGTMTVADAFRNMLNKIADYFLDAAARMIANQLQQSLLGMFSSLFSSGLAPTQGSRMPSNPAGMRSVGVGKTANDLTRHLANGGTAQKGKSYLVGERGAEIFTPGATGTVTPNHAMGATSIVVNVDASGTSVEGDESSGEELGRLIGAAVQAELIKEKRPGGLLG
tara:strand:+ start:165 stop:2438 length:2274 start_codon:yes stop_codon:yes gene_type:complete